MSEDSISITNLLNHPQQFSANGVKLSSLKETNKLLFNYFEKNGYKEDAIIYSTDIDRLKQAGDINNNEKLSIKEARKMGLEGSRKEIRSAIKQLNEIKTSELEENADGTYPVIVNEQETEFYDKKGVLLNRTQNIDNGSIETFYLNGNKNKVDKTIEKFNNGKDNAVTFYKDGNVNFPERKIIKENNETTEIKYDWFNDKLNSKTTSKGNDVETVIYKQVNGKQVPERIVSSFKSDPDSVKSVVNKFNDDGKIDGKVIEYSGAKIGENLIKEEISLVPGTDTEISKEATFGDNTKQYYQNFDGKLQQVGKDKNGETFVVLDVPEGWSMTKIANEFGISRDDLLKANTSEDGTENYYKSKKGVEYFYINDKAIIRKPTKIPVNNDIKLEYEIPTPKTIESDRTISSPNKKLIHNLHSSITTVHHNDVEEKDLATTAHSTKKPTNYSAGVKKRIANAQQVPYQYKSNKAKEIQRSFAGHDPRVLVKKSRTGTGRVGESLTEYNIKNTMCGIAKRGNSTLPSKLLRAYSKPNKKYSSGIPYSYNYNSLIADLKFVKTKIAEAKNLGYYIPPSLYAYIPPKDGNPKRIAMEVRAYEAVFGKGSAHYSI